MGFGNPLNQDLYDALVGRFGRVDIVSPGDQGSIRYCPDWQRGGRLRAIVQGGEYYTVDCPYCNDTRQRLWFNFRWGVQDAKTGSDMLHLVVCYNEHCVDSREKQEDLRRRLFPGGMFLKLPVADPPVSSGRAPSLPLPQPQLPEQCLRINSAPPKCLGSVYLRARGFDLDELWEKWRVRYSDHSLSPPPRFKRRIVIPVHCLQRRVCGGKVKTKQLLVGWQARTVEPFTPSTPKYLTAKGMHKSQYLYGLPLAVNTTGPLVICEGVTDVWRLGTNAVALLGKDLSQHQQNLFVEHFAGRPLVVFLDDDARENAKEARRKLLMSRKAQGDSAPVVIAQMPLGREDVGDCTREEAWGQVAAALNCPGNLLGVDLSNTCSTKRAAKIASGCRNKLSRP